MEASIPANCLVYQRLCFFFSFPHFVFHSSIHISSHFSISVCPSLALVLAHSFDFSASRNAGKTVIATVSIQQDFYSNVPYSNNRECSQSALLELEPLSLLWNVDFVSELRWFIRFH